MRADQYLTTHGHYDSRARAQAAIKAGLVSVDGKVIKKPSEKIKEGAAVRAGREHPWVSRGGIKLDPALTYFDVDPTGLTCLDVGASTGGFSHVLVSRGAAKVYAVDVGHGQLHADLKDESKILSMEGQDARTLSSKDLSPAPQLIVCDASFISAMKVLEIPLRLAAPSAQLITLVKPQFEVGKVNIGRGGLVKSEELGLRALDTVRHWVRDQGWEVIETCPSPIKGGSGNTEYLLHAKRLS
jgi:23S rRNA (cytidine1920-2'-O)/16S rRNA (cytidine1409-2'-O)-methyltransferase